ncbi:YdcF family protein [Sporosarcina cyprini]|uniref:YdcF family protein n=1 Tax=Sporosarcina cyprini TaxID=2910523 RepID=UPI001EDDD373|nr:YdcF family protein [Sporosarcina cyprini]MCG3087776.1 YdcF family protein [Sporosarcina cyprini]
MTFKFIRTYRKGNGVNEELNKRKKLAVAVGLILLCGIAIWVLTGKWIEDGMKPVADGSKQYAVILGAKVNGETPSLSLKYRLEKALEYAEAHPDVILILSGGQGPDEGISEAEAMRRHLTQHGVDEQRLIIEDQSTSTYENLLFTKRLLPETVDELTIISSDFHLARAKKLARDLGLQTDVVIAKTPVSVQAKQNIRERLALIKTMIMGK